MKDRLGAEIALIGIVLNSDRRAFVFEGIKEDDFGNEATRNVYRKLYKYWKENGSTDFTAVVNLLEGDERDAHGQCHFVPLERHQAQPAVKLLHVVDEEIGVFEIGQYRQIEH